MAELVRAGCEVSWRRGVFKVTHPVWGELKTSLRGGCPELAQEQAAKLVDQIEDKKLREFQDGVSMLKSKLDYLVREEKLPWTSYAMKFLDEGLAKDLWKAVRGLGAFEVFASAKKNSEENDGIGFPDYPDGKDYGALRDWDDGEDEVGKLMVQFQQAASMRELNVNGDGFQSSSRTRWVATTNYDIQDLKGEPQSEEGKNDLENKGWPMEWRRRLARAISDGNFRGSLKRDDGTLKAMTQEQWMSHVQAGHYPSRRDCLQCVSHGATGARGDRSKAAKMKYILVAKFTLPKSYVTGEFEPTAQDPREEDVGMKDLFDEDGHMVGSKGVSTEGEKDDWLSDEEDYVPSMAEEDGEEEEKDTGAGVGAIPMDVKAPESTYLLFAEPLLNDKGTTVASAIQSIVLYLQSLNIPVLRFHSDRAAQLMARSLVQWLHGSQAHYEKDPVLVHSGKFLLAGTSDDSGVWRKGLGEEEEVCGFRIVGKSAPRVAVMERSSEFGIYEDDLPSDEEVLCDDEDLGDGTQGVMIEESPVPRVAVLGSNRGETQDGHEDSMDPEEYAKEIIYNEDNVDEEVIKRLFELLPNQRLPRQTEDCGASGLPPKAWASGVYRHGGVLGVRKSSREFPYSTRLVNQFIREVLGDSTTWSTFSLHRNLGVKRHRDSHNARDELSYLIPISEFGKGGLWTQAEAGEAVEDDEAVFLDGKRGRVRPLQSEEGTKEVVSFNPRQWHATMPWTGDRLVMAVYQVRGLNQIKKEDEDLALDLGFSLSTNESESPRMCKLIGQEGEQPGPAPQEEGELELEPVEEFMYIRMSEEEWYTTIARYGPDRYVAEMAARWRRIEPEEGNLNSVIPAAIAADVDRDWEAAPRIFLMSEEGEELHVGRMLGTRTTRIPDHGPEGFTSTFLKACKIYNLVTNEEEMIVFWMQRRIVIHRALPEDQRHAWRGSEDPRPPDVDPRGRAPRLAAISVDDSQDLLRFVEVDTEACDGPDVARMMKATPETLYTTNIEELLEKVNDDNPLKVTHTVDPREVLPVVDKWVPAMQAELTALEKMPAIKRYKGTEAAALRRDPRLVIVPSKLVFTVKPGANPGTFRRKVRSVACGNFSGESAEELGDIYSAGATIDLVRLCLGEVNSNEGWIAATDDIKTAFLRAPIPDLPDGRRYAMEAPRAMIRAGLAEQGELWLATAAVYGFQRSPKWWSEHRNATARAAKWKSPGGGVMKMVACVTDENLHKLVEVMKDGTERIKGYVLFYVDDTLAVGPPEYVHGFYDWLESTWETSGREVVSKEAIVRFLGLELSLDDEGRMKITQRGYVDELLRKRQVTTYSKVPFVKEWATDEIPKDADCSPALIKEAQQRCGEILWTTQRSRPDAAYAAMMMSRLTT
ncbi:GIP, partial [Symbiodinium necroappetens]